MGIVVEDDLGRLVLEVGTVPDAVYLRPALDEGRQRAHAVLELAGINDVSAKIFSRSKNKLNNARATHVALSRLVR